MNQKGFANILLIVLAVVLAGTVGYFTLANKSTQPTPIINPTPTPTPTLNGEKIIRTVGERQGSYLIQKINPDSVEGLWYQEYPVARNEGTPKTLRIGDDIGYACEGVSEKLAGIDFLGQTVTFAKVVSRPPPGGCPI